MGSNQIVNVTFKVDGNIDPINVKMQQLSKAFKNIHLPKTLSSEFSDTIGKIEKEFEKFEKVRGKEGITQKDSNLINSSYERLLELIKQLNKEWNKIEGLDGDKLIDPDLLKTINQVEKAWKNFKETFEDLDTDADGLKELNGQLERQKKLVEELEQAEANYTKTTNANLTRKINSYTKQIAELENKQSAIAEKDNNLAKDRSIPKLEKDNQRAELAKEYADLGKQIEDLKIKQQELTNQIERNRNLPKLLKEAKDGLKGIEKEIENTVRAAKSEEIDNFRKKLKEILNLSDSEANKLPDTFEDLQKYVSSLKTDQIDKIKAAFPDLKQALSGVDDAAREGKEGVKEFNDELSESKARSQELEHVANQVKQFFSIGNTVQLFKRAIRSAFETIKELDAVMTQTAVVTDFSVGDMWAQLPEYTKRANELGVSVKGAYEAATLYYQQGLSTNEVIGVSNETLKMAKIAAIDYATATDYMTSALRGFNMEVNEQSAQKVNDIYSQLAAKTAADTEEISIAMSKTAPLAHNAGMEIETTAAFLAQAIETTREAPETLGTAMKTVIARFQELKKDPASIQPIDGETIDAHKIEGALRSIGVALRDTSGQFRDLDDVFLEISQKWNSLDTNTQRYIATIAAGSRQQSRFIAMMANYDRTMELVEMANTSAGASQQQFEKTLDSMQSKLDRLKNAWNEFTMGLANNSVIKAIVDLLTDLLNTINKISSGISGNNGILKSLVDISVLAGGLQLGRAAFTKFFGWLQGKSKVEGGRLGENLFKGFINLFSKNKEGKGGFLSKFLEVDSFKNWGKTTIDFLDEIPKKLDRTTGKIKELPRTFRDLKNLSKNIADYEKYIATNPEGADIFNSMEERYRAFTGFSTDFVKKINSLKTNLKDLKTSVIKVGKSFISTFLSVLPYIAAVGAAIGMVALLIKGIKAGSLEGKIKAAEESTRRAEEAAGQAKEAYDKLLEGRSTYSNLQATLDSLTYGTKAWKEQLIEANAQILDLIKTYPQLTQYLTSDNGRLQISAEGFDEVIKDQEEAIRRTTNDVIGSQIYKSNLETEKLYRDLQKELGLMNRPEFLNELIDFYKTNPIAFTKDENGEYRQELLDFVSIEGANILKKADPAKVIAAADAIGEYALAVQKNGEVIEDYVDNLVSNNLDIKGLSPDMIDSIKGAYNEKISEIYNNNINTEKAKLVDNYSQTSRDSEGVTKYLDTVLKEYGLAITGKTKTDLQTLYKYLANITGEEIDNGILKSEEAMAEAIARMRFGDVVQEGLDTLSKMLSTKSGDEIQKVLDVLGDDFTKFSSSELQRFGKLEKADIKTFSKAMGLTVEELEVVLDSLGYSFEDFKDEFIDSTNEMIGQIKQSKVDLVQAMLDSGSFTDSRAVNARLNGLSDQQITSLAGISGQISGLSKETQSSLFKELPYLYKQGYQEEIENLFKGLDFSDPINGLNQLQEAAVQGNEKVKEIAQTIINMEPDLFSAGNLFNDFMKSEDFEQINEDLGKLIKTNGKITAKNINELAESSQKLDGLLKTGTVSAGGLAKAINAINIDGIPIESFTTRVLEALSVTKTLEEELLEVQDYWANFDPGMDEGGFLDSINKVRKAVQEIADKGQYGNTALEGYLTSIYGADNLNLSSNYDKRKTQVDAMLDQLEKWEAGDGLGFITDAYERFGKTLGFTVENGKAILDVGKRTTEELVNDIAEAMGVTEEYAASQLALYSAHTPELKTALAENDFNKQIEELVKINGNELAVMNESELEAFAVATGQELDSVRDRVKSKGIKVVDFIDENTGIGYLGDELVKQIEQQLPDEEDFNVFKDLQLDYKFDEDGTLLLDIDTITERLKDLGLTAEQINSIFESDAFSNWLTNAEEAVNGNFQERRAEGITEEIEAKFSKTIDVPVRATDEEGNPLDYFTMKEVTVEADSVEGLDAAVDATLEAANYDLVAESVVNQDFTPLATNIEGILNTAAENAATNLETKINDLSFNDKSIRVKVKYQEVGKPAILSLQGYAKGTRYLNLNSIWSKVIPNNTKKNPGKTVNSGRGGGGLTFETEASGTTFGGLKHSEIALTGEEGYELAYNNHGAFLLGENGPEIAKLEKGTVIYPHDLSKKILKGYSSAIFPSYKTGTIPNYPVGTNGWTVEGGYTESQRAEVSNYSNAVSAAASVASSTEKTAENIEKANEETEKWENEVDWLYNMTQQINKELRIRNKLEREYNRALKTHAASGEELRRLTNQEIVSLKKRQDMQKEMIELRKKELHTYMMLNKEMMKYAIIDNWDDMTIHIAWDSINNITDKDEYDRAIAFKDKLEDFQKQVYDLEDDVEDIEDEILELQERGKDEYRDLEDRVLAALISEQQEMIDEQEKTNKSINDAKSSLIEAIQKNIDKMRQDRDNEEKESSIAEKERRLAYLRQDTTGSNALEIKQLEKELEKEKQDYSDTLIDQALKDLKEQNDEAQKQREKQIELAQSQLDEQIKTGAFADEATRIVREGLGPNGIMDRDSRLYTLLYKQEEVITNSNASRDKWDEDLADSISKAFVWLNNVLDKQNNGADIIESMKQNSQSWNAVSSSEQSALHAENERLAKEYEAATGEKLTYNSSEGIWYRENGERLYSVSKDDIAHEVVAKMKQNSSAWGSASESKQKELAAENEELARRLKKVLGQDIKKENGVWYIGSRKLYDVYEKGGLADFTGPAWLDGTKSKPEMVLNAKDTENFIQLKDILSNLRSGIVGRNTQGGDWYFDIDINVDEIANDYDVDKVAARIKQSIYEETAYRNVNAINFLK